MTQTEAAIDALVAEIRAPTKSDHEHIWLEPVHHDDDDKVIRGERLWCQDDVWGECADCGAVATKYVRADLFEASEARATRLEADLAIANRGGLDLLYAIRKAIGWTDKHGLSLLPDECARLARIASRKDTSIMPKYPPGYSGGFDGPTGAD